MDEAQPFVLKLLFLHTRLNHVMLWAPNATVKTGAAASHPSATRPISMRHWVDGSQSNLCAALHYSHDCRVPAGESGGFEAEQRCSVVNPLIVHQPVPATIATQATGTCSNSGSEQRVGPSVVENASLQLQTCLSIQRQDE
jgi:hypothetical protein